MKIDEIKKIFEILILKIENNLGENLEFNNDQEYYWDVLENEIFNIEREIKNDELSLGQISDDWGELERLLNDDEDPISYDLIRLAYLFIAIRKKSEGKW
jgi:hypothetical protein